VLTVLERAQPRAHCAHVMKEAEPDASLTKFLLDAQSGTTTYRWSQVAGEDYFKASERQEETNYYQFKIVLRLRQGDERSSSCETSRQTHPRAPVPRASRASSRG